MGLSTYQPIFLLKETVNKYKKSKSPLYIASLDAEKAYDSLWRMGLFYKLKDKMDENLWLILMSYYEKSDGIIKFNSTGECLININSGVKQGGVLSPFLFNYFINELIEKVINEEGGCKIGDIKTSISFLRNFFFFFYNVGLNNLVPMKIFFNFRSFLYTLEKFILTQNY